MNRMLALPALTDLVAGQVQVFFDTVTFLLPHIEAGKLRPLAVADEVRSAQLPDVPTTIESGFAKLQGTYWTGIVAPTGTPENVINKLNAAINAIMTAKDMEETLAKLSAKAKVRTPEEFAAFMAAETRKWTEVIVAANITAD